MLKLLVKCYSFTLLVAFLLVPAAAQASITGSISGIVTDPAGAVVPNAEVTVVEVNTNIAEHARTDSSGAYSFLALGVGRYRIEVKTTGFESYEQTGIALNANDALRIDVKLKLGQVTEHVEVTASAAHVETSSTQLGDVIGSTTMEALPLNGRSFTDLLGLQPGVIPVESGAMYWFSTQTHAGNLSVNGQRESSNGYEVNGGNVEETLNNGAGVVPNLDSIAEFRLITSNFDAEYGHYSGGMVNVVTKSGTNAFHGDAFEFLRNDDLDSRNFYNYDSVNPITGAEIPGTARGAFKQNQFGGTLGGPILRDKVFFFADYQGTRTRQGVSSGLIPVPSLAERTGDFSADNLSSVFTGSVNGTYFANLLSQRLGYPVTANEAYWTPGCTNSSQCVFPNGIIPTSAFAPTAIPLRQFIPVPNDGPFFQSTQNNQHTRDDLGGVRVDGNSRWGMLMAYYNFRGLSLLTPFGDNNIPGFPTQAGRHTQQLLLGDTKSLGAAAVNEFRFSLLRYVDHLDQAAAAGEWGIKLSDYGFEQGVPGGWTTVDPKYEGIPSIGFLNYSIGAPQFFYNRFETLPQVLDNFSKVAGKHTLKVGGEWHYTNFVEYSPIAGGNGWFSFSGSETGTDFADFLIGAVNPFSTQSAIDTDERKNYVGTYAQDSWRVRTDLTVNYGLRWELIQPWYERSNQRTNFVEGAQSTLFPDAPEGVVFAGDNVPGYGKIPRGSAHTPYHNFGPRIGIAYSPSASGGLLGWLTGGPGKSSVRAAWGMFYQTIEGVDVYNVDPEPPYIQSYTSPVAPLLEAPLTDRATGNIRPQVYPFVFSQDGGAHYNWHARLPLGGIPAISINNRTPYTESYQFTLQRQIGNDNLLSVGYAGNQSHALMTNQMMNPGNEQLCLSLSQPSEVLPGTPTCGPFGESGVYTEPDGTIVNGTRAPFGSNFGDDVWATTIGNSIFNSLQVSLRHTAGRLSFLAGYTYSKAMDNASSINDVPVNPLRQSLSKALSAFDLTNNFVISYNYQFPFDHLAHNRLPRLTDGWRLAGATHFATGFPVSLGESDDLSLLGSTGGGAGKVVDAPNYTPGSLQYTNPRTGLPYFNTSLFSSETLGHLGNSNRQFFHGPGLNNFDMALLKDLKLNERMAFQFRGEFFNIFNHAQFMNPNGNIDSGIFGLVTGARDPRIGQVALKLLF